MGMGEDWMRNTKYRFESFMLFDYDGVAKHLEKMAAKGWRFEKVGSIFWKYKKAEPANVKYSVTFAPDASEYDPEPTERQKSMEEYCKEAGWEKVGSLAQMQIFCSENPDAVPVDTDEAMRLAVTQKAMRKNFIPTHILLLFVFVMNAFNQYTFGKRDWTGYFAENSKLWLWGIILWGFFLVIYEMLYYFAWLMGAKKAVANGKKCPSPSGYRKVHKVTNVTLVLLLAGLLASYSTAMLIYEVTFLAGYFGIIAVVNAVRNHLKKDGVSRHSNMAVTLAVDIVLAFALVFGLTFGVIGIGLGREEKEPVRYYETDNHLWEIYEDTLPLTVQDFVETDYPNYSYEAEEKTSILVSAGEYRQRSFPDGENAPGLYYEIVTVKVDWLYDFFLNDFMKKEFRYLDADEIGEYQRIDVAVAEGIQVYRQYINKIPSANEWLLRTGDKIIALWLDFEPTEAQLKLMADTLVR